MISHTKLRPRPFVLYDLPKPKIPVLEPVYNFFTPDERTKELESKIDGTVFNPEVEKNPSGQDVYTSPNTKNVVRVDSVDDTVPRYIKIHFDGIESTTIKPLNLGNNTSGISNIFKDNRDFLNIPEVSNSPYDTALTYSDAASYIRVKNKTDTVMRLSGFSEGASSEESVETFFPTIYRLPSYLKSKLKDKIDFDAGIGVGVNYTGGSSASDFYKDVQGSVYRSKVDVRHHKKLSHSPASNKNNLRRSSYRQWNQSTGDRLVPKMDSSLLKDVALVSPPGYPAIKDGLIVFFSLNHVGFILQRYSSSSTEAGSSLDKEFIINTPFAGTYIDTSVRYGVQYTYTLRYIFQVRFGVPEINSFEKTLEHKLFLTSEASDPVSVSIKDIEPPDEPAAVFYTFNYKNKQGLRLVWQYPVTRQRDVKYYQIFRRKNMQDPFTCIAEIDFDDSFVKTARSEKVRADKVIKKTGPISFFEDIDFKVNSSYIYAVAAVDAHGLTSGYSSQTRVSYNKNTNSLVLKSVSPAGAPKQYPNFYMDPDEDPNTFINTITQDVIRTSGFKKMTVYFDPDAMTVKSNRIPEVSPNVFPVENGNSNKSSIPKGVFKMTLLDVDRQKSKTLELSITDAREYEFFS